MNRREFIERSAVLGMVATFPAAALSKGVLSAGSAGAPLKPPSQGGIPVAFLISDGAVIIDFCGPWEVFQDVNVPGRGGFSLYTVAETMNPIRASGGMKIVPDYTLEAAPSPKVIVIPAQSGQSAKTLEWIRKASRSADMTMSVCTGALLLARTGLLSGKAATTHHNSFKQLAMDFSDIQVKRGARFVDEGRIATAGGLSSGIDLALHVVERYFGHEVAEKTAYHMEYQGEGWKKPDSNASYAEQRVSTPEHPLCPICSMEVDAATAPKSIYRGKTYYFCMPPHKAQFDASPEKWL
jgi:transcriptional regulator GlxA family with amidase domain/YHS domain-containing protein